MSAKRILSQLIIALFAMPLLGSPNFRQNDSILTMSNGNVVVRYDLTSGTADFYWQNTKKISAFQAAVRLSNSFIASPSYSNRTWARQSSNSVAVFENAVGQPQMVQVFTLDQPDSFLTRVEMRGTNLSANWMSPLVVSNSAGVDIGITNDNRALFVPFDNDHFVSYKSEDMNSSNTSCEVGAFYDNVSRNGLVVGSVTHDTWKTGVHWSGSNNKLGVLQVFGGLTSHFTWDVMPHGAVSGNTISSPTIFVGYGSDWRTTIENYGNENALFAPRLVWTNGVPFGWNSWGVLRTEINYQAAVGVSDAIHAHLQNNHFNNDNTVYVNLDSFWKNLWTDQSGSRLTSFVQHCHANGQRAGIYFTPFVYWGDPAGATNQRVPVGYPPDYSKYHFSDVLLRDNAGNCITNDNGLAMDPTHPGTKGYIDYYAHWFSYWGFDYVKLDFLSHGALEGMHHDTNVTTGIQAYNEGMAYLLKDLGSMFISESIAPIFPYQYAHSRRIACDAEKSRISDTRYTMNAVSLGWWIGGRLYEFNDPDMMVFADGANTNENQSRLINCAITGLFLDGDNLAKSSNVPIAESFLTNAAINAVARVGQTFRPLDGAKGKVAAHILVRQDGPTWRIAVFNYSDGPTNVTVDLSSAGLQARTYIATDLWSGAITNVSGSMNVSLNAAQAKLFSLNPNATHARR